MSNNFLEIEGIEEAQKLLENIPNGIERATTRAINRSLTTLKKNLKKEVTKNYGIKSTDVEKSLSTQKATFTAMKGIINSRSPVTSMYKFAKGNSKKGVTVLIKRSEGRKRVKGKSDLNGLPFIARMSNGHYGIFQRNKKKRRVQTGNKSSVKEGLTQLNTLSTPQMLGNETVMEYVQENGAKEMLQKNFEREVEKVLEGYYKW